MNDSDLFALFCIRLRADQTGLSVADIARAILQFNPEQIKAAAEADRAYRQAVRGE